MDPLLYDFIAPFVPRAAMPWTCAKCGARNWPELSACQTCDPEAYAAELEVRHASL